MDLEGHWNHGALDIHSIILMPELASELAEMLTEAAKQAPLDCEEWLKENPE